MLIAPLQIPKFPVTHQFHQKSAWMLTCSPSIQWTNFSPTRNMINYIGGGIPHSHSNPNHAGHRGLGKFLLNWTPVGGDAIHILGHFRFLPQDMIKKFLSPGQCDSVTECWPMHRLVIVLFLVRVHAQVVGSVPIRGLPWCFSLSKNQLKNFFLTLYY